MSSNQTRVRTGFNRLAPVYDLLLRLSCGPVIPRIRRSLLHCVPARKCVLIAGGGTGAFLLDLLAQVPVERVYCYDISRIMLERSAKRLARHTPLKTKQVHFVEQALPAPDALPDCDLICTNFFLDLFTDAELPSIFDQLHAALPAGGLWYYSDFAIPKNRYLQGPGRLVIHLLYLFFAVTCGLRARRLPDVEKLFDAAGYQELARHTALGGLLVCKLFQKPVKTF